MFTSEFNERSRSNPLCDFRLGTVVTSDHETPLTHLGAMVCTLQLWLGCAVLVAVWKTKHKTDVCSDDDELWHGDKQEGANCYAELQIAPVSNSKTVSTRRSAESSELWIMVFVTPSIVHSRCVIL